jgi:hypothetical protein
VLDVVDEAAVELEDRSRAAAVVRSRRRPSISSLDVASSPRRRSPSALALVADDDLEPLLRKAISRNGA